MSEKFTRAELFRGLFSAIRERGGKFIAQPKPRGESLLRPPGALVPDSAYLAACTGCEKCVAACPQGSIFTAEVNDAPGKRVAVIHPARMPCYLCTDLPCIPACPDGALVNPGGPARVRIGVAQVNPKLCRTFREELCDLCVQHCPLPGEAIRMVGARPVVISGACTGCGLCHAACPESPKAIDVIPERFLIAGMRIPRPW